jgi:hypothetical protein
MRKFKLGLMLVAAVAVGFASNANAQEIVLLDGTASPAADFTFAAFDGAPPTSTSEGIVFAVPSGTADNFGGAGFRGNNLANIADLSEATAILVTARADAGNTSGLVVAIREDFGDSGTVDEGEFFSFLIPATDLTSDFTTISIDPADFIFNGTGNGAGGTNNGTLDANLFEVGIQSPFGGNDPLNVTIQSVAIAVPAAQVPEPSSLALLLGAVPALALRRRRR